MSSSNAQIARFETLRSLAFGSISGTYAAIGSAFLNASRSLDIENLSDVTMTFSMDGVNDHFVIPAQAGKILDFSSNRGANANLLVVPANTVVYVKQTSGAASMGSVYVTNIYASNV